MNIESDTNSSWNLHLSNHQKEIELLQAEGMDHSKNQQSLIYLPSNENRQICATLPPLPDLIPLRITKKRENGEEEADEMANENYGVECNHKSDSSQITIKIKKKTNFNFDELSISTITSQHSNQETNISTDSIIMTPSTEDNPEETSRTSSPSQLSKCENKSIVKTEPVCVKDSESQLASEPIVTLRKSDRKKVARDIFFLFEEMPTARKRSSSSGRSTNRVVKPKFGHLSAAVDVKPNIRQLKSSLKIYKEKKKTTIPQPTAIESQPKPQTIKIKPLPPITSNTEKSSSPVPRVNPIFLFVKQDDTRIIEVRCEDYDKRNRIKLTKTDKGWRSVPRSDPSSSRVFKMFDQNEDQDHEQNYENFASEETDCNTVKKCHKKKKKKKKKVKHKAKDVENDYDNIANELVAISNDNFHKVYENTNHDRVELNKGDITESDLIFENLNLNSETNNNEETIEELTKNLTQISDDIDLDIELTNFVVSNNNIENSNSPVIQLCPETGLFVNANGDIIPSSSQTENHQLESNESSVPEPLNIHNIVEIPDHFDPNEMDTKNLKELLEDADLLQHCSDNALSGAELIDSLMKRGCEDVNHISSEDHINSSSVCLNDFENEEEDLLSQQEPVEDIISRLSESLTTSPKCLSFNESGDIEGMHGELYQRSTQSDVFNSALDELSITIKNIEQSKDVFNLSPKEPEKATIVSPDSCADEQPKDLTCKRGLDSTNLEADIEERAQSRSSDAIQSPQPSGLPPVPPSPDISSKTKFLEQLLHSSTSSSTNIPNSLIKIPTLPQKEPLDLGKHRKSASPTVSCSQDREPASKRLKRDISDQCNKDPDPLTQLKLLIKNSEWKVPDPILVPKDRLSAVLASPAREIPLLLTTRPELRLPEAFSFPSILHDPEILVISISQLENILEKQLDQCNKLKNKHTPIQQLTLESLSNDFNKNFGEKQKDIDDNCKFLQNTAFTNKNIPNSQNASIPNLGNDVDPATIAAFNKMFWLPYLNQMAPDLLKSMKGIHGNNNLAEILPILLQQQKSVISNPIGFQNPLEFAMWQGALNQAHLKHTINYLKNNMTNTKNTLDISKSNNIRNMFGATSLPAKQNTKKYEEINSLCLKQNSQNKQQAPLLNKLSNDATRKVLNPFYRSSESGEDEDLMNKKSKPPETKPRVTCKSITNLLQPDRIPNDINKFTNLMTMPTLNSTTNSSNTFSWQKQSTSSTTSRPQHSNSSLQSHMNINNTHTSKLNNQNSSNQNQGKLKVKSGTHLLDPAALQRRLITNISEESPSEVVSTTNGIDDGMMTDPNSPLWHPLFGK